MTHYLDARERVFVAMQERYAEVYSRHLPPGVVLTYDSPGGDVEGFKDEIDEARALLTRAIRGPARRYPGDGNRHERRKAAAERRRGR